MNRLKELRTKNSYTQKQIADELFMSVDAYGRRERGDVALKEDEIRALVRRYNCSWSELLGDKEV